MATWLTTDSEANELLDREPLALLTGMLLDQQVTIETAFAGPKKILERVGSLDARVIAEYDPQRFAELCSTPPAIHRFPGSMAKRIQAMCQELVDTYDGRAEGVWTAGNPNGAEVLKRLKALPGFGEGKAKIFLALLGKQRGLTATGWRKAAGDYAKKGSFLSVADIVDEASLLEVRAYKKEMKAAAKAKKA
ncbi:HhH-GPD-type base excision DNA repair protein [Actinophytocola gossypii]|uniref:Fe-S cluster assembly protein HesB n=1 Tax=Actinophytocola gossypii TaxID=2812003 RepID=A0ABT2JE18_9PSEU|nr:HhH-GPD-type base excision DNA repair protein [Actinophytocola gossypii]MCT2586107.1 Fe-S cluster assembly protein HesB [Actinophytocola gossypii]